MARRAVGPGGDPQALSASKAGFDKFAAVHRAAREGRNPSNGESIQIAAKTVPKFSAGAELKKAVA